MPLQRFWTRWPAAQQPLKDWYRDTRRARWGHLPDVKATFGQTDQVRVASGNMVCVFDIGGNKFRLIAKVSFEKQKVYVLRVLTHKEYDREHWKAQL